MKCELSHDRVAPNTDQTLTQAVMDLKVTLTLTIDIVQGSKGKYSQWTGQESQHGNQQYKIKREL